MSNQHTSGNRWEPTEGDDVPPFSVNDRDAEPAAAADGAVPPAPPAPRPDSYGARLLATGVGLLLVGGVVGGRTPFLGSFKGRA